jgi:hypothetical protein
MLLVGSRALRHAGAQYLTPDVKRQWDFDFISTYEEFVAAKKKIKNITRSYPTNKGKAIVVHTQSAIYEFEIAWPGSTAEELLSICKVDNSIARPAEMSFDVFSGIETFIARPNLIFTLKKSHRFLKDSPHFLKTMLDFRHLRSMGCEVPEALTEWYKKREKSTYWYKMPKLDVKKDEFFKDDGIKYIVFHDDIHESVKRFDRPAYTYYMKDGAEVQTDKNKFFACPREIQLAGVVEEAATLAIERSLLPLPGVWTPKYAWTFALNKVCSSITGGYFRAFAYENYFDVLNLYPEGYWEKFQKDLAEGKVRYIEQENN